MFKTIPANLMMPLDFTVSARTSKVGLLTQLICLNIQQTTFSHMEKIFKNSEKVNPEVNENFILSKKIKRCVSVTTPICRWRKLRSSMDRV